MGNRVLVWAAVFAMAVVVREGHAASTKGPTSAGGPIQPATERMLAGGRSAPLRSQAARGTEGDREAGAGRPTIRGPKIPDSLRAQLKGRLEARVSADVSRLKELRGEAIGLLRQFVAEAPRGSPEMPKTLVRLGAFEGGSGREGVADPFYAWGKAAGDLRGR